MKLTGRILTACLGDSLMSVPIADCLSQIVAVTQLVESGSAVNLLVQDETGCTRAVIANVSGA